MSVNGYDASTDTLHIAAGTPRQQLNQINTELHGSINQLGSKNLLPITAVTTAVSGVTITVNSDGSITANGTASAQIDFTLYSGSVLEAGDYIVSKCADDSSYTSASDFNYVFVLTQGGTSHIVKNEDIPLTFTATTFSLVLRIKSGTILSNKKFYPMIRPASILNNIWAPYAKTNKVLTKDIATLNSALNKYQEYSDSKGSVAVAATTANYIYLDLPAGIYFCELRVQGEATAITSTSNRGEIYMTVGSKRVGIAQDNIPHNTPYPVVTVTSIVKLTSASRLYGTIYTNQAFTAFSIFLRATRIM